MALTTARDDEIPGLVAERRALREELSALQDQEDDVVPLDVPRGRARRQRF
jgi:hypothetical protein